MTAPWRGYQTTPRPVVYRVYDQTGRLIYIGATRSIAGRMYTHELQSWWHPLVGEVGTVDYPTMAAAYAAEMVAIQEEQPAFNVKYTTSGPVLTAADVEVLEASACGINSYALLEAVTAVRQAATRSVA